MSAERVSGAALAVLTAATCSGDRVTLPAVKLEPPVYAEVNEVLVRLGGKWKRTGKPYPDGTPKGVHVFPYDPEPLLCGVVEAGQMPPKNPTAFFPTPAPVVARLLELVGIPERVREDFRVLEPSAGTGAIADAVREAAPSAHLALVEVLGINAATLRAKGHAVHECDFLDFDRRAPYDAIPMNPPFALDGDKTAWVTHVERAWEHLADGGELAAVVPSALSFHSGKRIAALRARVLEVGGWERLPDGAFKESGTGVNTCILYMAKGCTPRLAGAPRDEAGPAVAPVTAPADDEHRSPAEILDDIERGMAKAAAIFRDLRRTLSPGPTASRGAESRPPESQPDLFSALEAA